VTGQEEHEKPHEMKEGKGTIPLRGQARAPVNLSSSPHSGREGEARTASPGEGATRAPINARSFAWLIGTALIFAAMLGLYFYPGWKLGPSQPIPFSHRVHAGVKAINCRFCHPGVERSQSAGLPSSEKCFFCHTHIIPNHPEIRKEERYRRENRPIPWVRVFWIPDITHFNHIPHVKWAKLDCITCHGDVKSKDRIERVDFKMGFCLNCHRKMDAQTDCWLACHR
jgi:hypothetical protein